MYRFFYRWIALTLMFIHRMFVFVVIPSIAWRPTVFAILTSDVTFFLHRMLENFFFFENLDPVYVYPNGWIDVWPPPWHSWSFYAPAPAGIDEARDEHDVDVTRNLLCPWVTATFVRHVPLSVSICRARADCLFIVLANKTSIFRGYKCSDEEGRRRKEEKM